MKKTFIIKRKSKLYEDFFASKEKEEYVDLLVNNFLIENGLLAENGTTTIKLTKRLMVSMTKEMIDKHQRDIKPRLENGLHLFRMKSSLNKLWISQVYEKIEERTASDAKYWAAKYCKGRLTSDMWNLGADVYAIIESNCLIGVPNDAIEIDSAEYNRVHNMMLNLN